MDKALCRSKKCPRFKLHDVTALCPQPKKRPYMVYALVPVNVRVLARSKKAAQALALESLNRSRPLDLSSDDNATYQAMYIDGDAPATIDAQFDGGVTTCSKSKAVTFVNEEDR